MSRFRQKLPPSLAKKTHDSNKDTQRVNVKRGTELRLCTLF